MSQDYGYDRDFSSRMQLDKDLAISRRNRGLGLGGKGYGTRKRIAAADPVKGSFERLYAQTKASWACSADCLIEDYLRAVLPERYEGFEL